MWSPLRKQGSLRGGLGFGLRGSRLASVIPSCGYGPLRSQGRQQLLVFAYFPASLRARFPTTILSLIRSFARHPALLSRETKVTIPTRRIPWHFDNSAQRRQ